MSELILGPDGKRRCRWSASAPEFVHYHDAEWGFPVGDDHRLFEKLCLEGFQSGLSWRTILAKRQNSRAAFHDFDFGRIARFTERDVARLLRDDGIVRHRGKIEAVINNAKRARELAKQEGALAAYLWRYEPTAAALVKPQTASTSAASIALSKDLQETRLVIRRPDHRPCLHAGHGAHQRPCRRLCDQAQGRARAQGFQAAAGLT